MRDLASIVAKAFGVTPDIQYLAERSEVLHAYASHEKIRQVESMLGLGPKASLEVGVRRMAEWARRNGPKSTPPFMNIEVRRNLPATWC